ncbi:MAG: site-specific integrase [Sphingomonadales bacterium]|jgi:integrase
MASIWERINRGGSVSFRATVRRKGRPSISRTFYSREEAIEWAKTVEESWTDRTVAKAISKFITSASKPLAADPIRHLTWIGRQIGDLAVCSVDTATISKLQNELQNTLTTKGAVRSPATVERYMSTLSSLLTFAWQKLGWISHNPAYGRRRIVPRPIERSPLSRTELRRLLEACSRSPNPNLFPAVLLAVRTGALRSEIERLKWSEVDIPRRRVALGPSGRRLKRVVSIDDECAEALEDLKIKSPSDSTLVFGSLKGGNKDLGKALKTALESRRLPPYTFHELSSTFAIHSLSSGLRICDLKQILGHRTYWASERYIETLKGMRKGKGI